jgi:hypothetical protein
MASLWVIRMRMMLYLKRKFAWVQRKLKTGVYVDGCTFVTSVARNRNSSNSLLKRCFRTFFKEPANSVKLHRKRRRPAIPVVQCADFARLGRPYARVRDRSDSQRRSDERLIKSAWAGSGWYGSGQDSWSRTICQSDLSATFSLPSSEAEADRHLTLKLCTLGSLQQATIDHVNAAIKNVLQALLVEYDPQKKSSDLTKPADRQFLFELL